jgi:aspartate ammonia-lyase
MRKFREETDLLGQRQINNSAWYGIHTVRALENFNISGLPMYTQPTFIQAYVFVKKACAIANNACGVLDKEKTHYILQACDAILAGKYVREFCTDLIQGGAGTSVNMNVNEVVANVALMHAGRTKGDYLFIHPNNHVNCSQSTNDTYPTALALCLFKKTELLIEALEQLRNEFLHKAKEFRNVLKMGRTQLQDAVPMLLGQEFHGFASSVTCCITSLTSAQQRFCGINIGGTAIGTSINAPANFPAQVTDILSQMTGIPLHLKSDLISAGSDCGDYIQLSAALKRSALVLSKISSDLRLLSSGPRAGFNEIQLPPLQAGSSIMPGKINPVVPEVMNQTAYYVAGADVTVSMAAEAGQLQLNVMEPVIAYSLFQSLDMLHRSVILLSEKCVKGIVAHQNKCEQFVFNSIGIVTALSPYIGYETSSDIAKEALKTGKSVFTITVRERGLLSEMDWSRIVNATNLVYPVILKGIRMRSPMHSASLER